mgnify:CR=1 FL=1
MSSPQRYLIRMLLFILAVVLSVAGLYPTLAKAFMANPALNGLIIGVLILGIFYIFRQVMLLMKEVFWLDNFRSSKTRIMHHQKSPQLLAPMAAMLGERGEQFSLSALSLRSILDGISSRLTESRDLSRYLIGLLIFLGLLGTFWGLLQTISSVSSVINTLDIPNTNINENIFNKILNGLNAPMSGMSTAFSSSLFGLGSSLILGFLDLQVGQANNRFFNELEDWLSQMAIFTTTNEPGNVGLGEAAIENLAIVSKRAAQQENENVRISEKLNDLNLALNRLVEKLDEEKNLTEQLNDLNVNVKNILETDKINSAELLNGLTIELRAIGKQINNSNKSK